MWRETELPFLKLQKMKMPNFTFCELNVKGRRGVKEGPR